VNEAETAVAGRLNPAPRTAAQRRIMAAALELFTEHGVSATSLQMIADSIGVTKAAVYHQFKTKEELVLAAAEVDLMGLQTALDAAEAQEHLPEARVEVLRRVIDLAVERRRMVGAFQRDPVMVRFLAEHEPFRQLMERLYTVLTGGDPGPEARVRAAMFSAAIGGAVMHPLVVDLDDETLRANLLHLARRLIDLPD
jgi:AcrR family transcriptional regulator